MTAAIDELNAVKAETAELRGQHEQIEASINSLKALVIAAHDEGERGNEREDAMSNTDALGLGGLVAPVVAPNPAEIAADKAARAAVNDTMAAVIGDLYRPKSLSLQEQSAKRDGPVGRHGWIDSVPLRSPPGQDIIARLCDAMLGPAVPKRKEEQ
ncbi:MAG TPA: hypothetical protein VE396_13135 [Xanthobacteraceae bacterium]|jgi:outer membrane murein-binding lipoprotein Lpp|nr:hypothetical protein [Xanthobacteraceae bacterium]